MKMEYQMVIEDANGNGRINIEENRYWRFQYGVYFNIRFPRINRRAPVDWSHGVQALM